MYIDLLYIILFDKDTFLYINEGQISFVHLIIWSFLIEICLHNYKTNTLGI